MFAWSVGYSFCFTEDLSDCEGGPPFVLRGSNSDVQVTAAELQMVSMSSSRLGTFLHCLLPPILLTDFLLWKKKKDIKISVNSIWKTWKTQIITVCFLLQPLQLKNSLQLWHFWTIIGSMRFPSFVHHHVTVCVQVLPAFIHSADVEEKKTPTAGKQSCGGGTRWMFWLEPASKQPSLCQHIPHFPP